MSWLTDHQRLIGRCAWVAAWVFHPVCVPGLQAAPSRVVGDVGLAGDADPVRAGLRGRLLDYWTQLASPIAS
jgi:hypothetical protein